MAELFGAAMPEIPSLNLTGFFSSTWAYVLIIFILGIILLGSIGIILFLKTYPSKAIIFRHGFNRGIEKKTRIRNVILGHSGLSIFKCLFSSDFIPSDSLPMYGKTYWFERGKDGYLRNFILKPDGSPRYIHNEMRVFEAGIDMQSKQDYANTDKMAKIMMYGTVFIFLLILVVGMYVIVGKYNEGKTAELETAKLNQQVLEAINVALDRLASMPYSGGSGLIPAGV